MEFQDGLTNLQKVALGGEVAFTICTAAHDAEVKYRIYMIFKEVEEEYKEILIQSFKEAVTFDENIVDQLYLESLTNKVPVWLWIEKNIEDLKESIKLAESTPSRLSTDRIDGRKKLVESAFICFARKALLISPDASEQLFDTILDTDELDFLHTSCFYLKSCCKEVRDSGRVQDEVPDELMECSFDIRDMLSLRLETEALHLINQETPKRRRPRPPKKEVIQIETNLTEDEISELLSKKIMETFKGVTKPIKRKPPQHFQYVVNKVFTNTNISTSIRTCKTRKEAEEFIELIKKEYPELTDTCDFFISKEKRNGR